MNPPGRDAVALERQGVEVFKKGFSSHGGFWAQQRLILVCLLTRFPGESTI